MTRVLAVAIVAACASQSSPQPLSSKGPPQLGPAGPPIIVNLTIAREGMCACKDAGCAHAAQAKLRTWETEHRAPGRDDPDPVTARQIDALFAAYGKCLIAATATVPPDLGWAPQCDIYEFRIFEIASCAKLPRATRYELTNAYLQASAAWAAVPAEARDALNQACKATGDAVLRTSIACRE